MNKKIISCEDLQGSIYFGPDALRHCCQRFFVKGKIKGDVEIFKVNSDDDLNVKKIVDEKKRIINNLNNKIPTACDGCPKLERKNWKNDIKINKISIEIHSKCNARCSYCSEMYYGGLNPKYDFTKFYEKLSDNKIFEEDVSVTWGGGEPVLLKNFASLLKKISNFSSYPTHKDIRIYSNSFIYNDTLHKYLNEGKIILTTSVDAGTYETFKKVRGVKKGFKEVFKNLEKYSENPNAKVIIKYILTSGNHEKNEIDSFVKLINEHNLSRCNFEISSDYKFEKLTLNSANNIIYFYNKLQNIKSKSVLLDDHVRKRIKNALLLDKKISEDKLLKLSSLNPNEKIIIWGTGGYAKATIKNSMILNDKRIAFFVDEKKFSKKNNYKFYNKEIKTPEDALNSDKRIFIASSTYWQVIHEKILSLGIDNQRIIKQLII